MARFTILLALTLACGCGPSNNASTEILAVTESNDEFPQHVSAFEFDETVGVISLDTQIPPGQRRGYGIGQGSVTLETIDTQDGNLTFHYTPEIEGGYTVYECTVPVSALPVTVKVNRDGTPGETSFDLSKCRVVKSGNVHWE